LIQQITKKARKKYTVTKPIPSFIGILKKIDERIQAIPMKKSYLVNGLSLLK
jgi:hypothetical protein